MGTKRGKTQKRKHLLQAATAMLLASCMLFAGCSAQKTTSEPAAEPADRNTAETAVSAAAEQPELTAETPILTAEQPQLTTETPMGEAGTWTIFVYMCGSNLESGGGMASINLLQIMSAIPSDKVNIIVQTGGSESWGMPEEDESSAAAKEGAVDSATIEQVLSIDGMDYGLIDVSADVLQRYRVTDHMELLEELPLASMGAEDTFYDFLKWGVENYPAEHMGVIMWDHGGAGIAGVCTDDLFNNDSLLPFEMNEALARLLPDMTDRFEFIGFDACLMSTVEVANSISPFARYMYASEETIPGFGWAYPEIINALNTDPTQDGAALGQVVCDSYRALYSEVDKLTNGSSVDTCTLSVTNLEKMNDVVDALDAVGDKLVEALDTPADLKKVTQAALHTESFAYSYMLDMGSLAEALQSVFPEEAKALQDTLREAIVCSTHGSFSADSTGMAIFYPRPSMLFTSADESATQLITRYALCAPSKSYYEFVKEMQFIQYRSLMSGVSNVHVLEEPHLESVDEENAAYAMTLNPADLDKVAEMYYQIWMLYEKPSDKEDGATETYAVLLGNRPGVQFDETTGKVIDEFDGSWKWVTLNGVPLELNIQSYDDEEVIYRAPILLNDNATNLIVRWVKATDSYELLGTYTGFDSETNTLSRMIYALHDGDVIIPRYEMMKAPLAAAGAMEYPVMGYGISTYQQIIPEYATTYDQDNTRLEYTALEDGDYYFQYYLTDIYGSKKAFEAMQFTMQDKKAYVNMPEDAAAQETPAAESDATNAA